MGAAVRRLLEEQGDTVIGVDVRDAEVVADLATSDGRAAAIAAIRERSGGALDRLVVCAGLGPHVEPASLLVSVNYFGAVELLDGLLDVLRAGTDPAAVAISSNSIGIIPMDDTELVDAMLGGDEAVALSVSARFDGASIYGMTKQALARAVRQRSAPWGEAGVRLNAVAPGPVLTPLLQGSLDNPILGPFVDALPVPLGRRATPEEVAAIIVYLIGPATAFVHGSIVFVDGGTDALLRPDHA